MCAMRVFAVKAGDYYLGVLTKQGRQQMRRAVSFLNTLQPPIYGLKTLLVHTSEPGALKSVSIIKTNLEIQRVKSMGKLYKYYFEPENIYSLFGASGAVDNVIIVSDDPEMEKFLAQYVSDNDDSEKYETKNGDIFLVAAGPKPQKIFSPS